MIKVNRVVGAKQTYAQHTHTYVQKCILVLIVLLASMEK